MKIFVASALVAILVFSTCIPSFAQRGRTVAKPIITDGPVQFESIEAFCEERGALVRWRTSTETNNVGFSVYRSTRRGTELVNPSMIIGSYGRAGTKTTFGESYQVFDPKGKPGTSYFIKSYLLDGGTISSDAVIAKAVDSLLETTGTSAQDMRETARSTNGNIQANAPVLPPELLDAVQSSTSTPDPNTQRWVAAQPGAKITVDKDGFYRITRDRLQNAGFAVGSDSTKWRLFALGVEQAITVGPNAQFIEFYGKGTDTIESNSRIYYLIADSVVGKRISTRVLRSFSGTASASHYTASLVQKERTTYVSKIINGDDENFWGHTVYSAAGLGLMNVNLSGVNFQAANVLVTIKMQGFSPTTHNEIVTINGHQIGIVTGGFGQVVHSGDFLVPTSYLVEGNNVVDLYTTVSGDYDLFDSLTVKYERNFTADQNKVQFSSPATRKFDLKGFSSPNVRVFDVTYDGTPQQIINLPIVQSGITYSVKFPSNRQSLYYAVEDSAVLDSPFVGANTPTTLSTPANAANLIIISHSAPSFMAAAETWASYRRKPNFAVKVVDVADIFDEYNYGTPGADSIKSFLDYAYHNWQTPPQYVLLLGDGSYDPKNYQGFGSWNLVPAKFVVGIYDEHPSDEALVDFDNDGLAEMAIGRIPARSGFDITNSFNKTVNFESPANLSLNRGALFAYDVAAQYNFYGFSQDLRNQLPLSVPASFVGRGDNGSQATLLTEMNKGRYIVNYSGHGSTGVWASGSLFGPDSVPQLTNSDKPSVYAMLTCYNGYFVRPDANSLGESLLLSPSGGSVATWASTTETTPDFQNVMGGRFYNQLGVGQIKRLGDLIKDAKTTVPGSDVAFSWALLGDPMLQMLP